MMDACQPECTFCCPDSIVCMPRNLNPRADPGMPRRVQAQKLSSDRPRRSKSSPNHPQTSTPSPLTHAPHGTCGLPPRPAIGSLFFFAEVSVHCSKLHSAVCEEAVNYVVREGKKRREWLSPCPGDNMKRRQAMWSRTHGLTVRAFARGPVGACGL
jgi:hypothetical protein